MQDVCAETCKFKHLVIRDFAELFRVLNNSRVSRIYAVNIGVYLALVRVQSRRNRNRRGVASAPAKGGNIIVFVYSLKSGNNRDVSAVKLGFYSLCVNPAYSRVAVRGVGSETCLPTGKRHNGMTYLLDCHSKQSDRDLLTA